MTEADQKIAALLGRLDRAHEKLKVIQDEIGAIYNDATHIGIDADALKATIRCRRDFMDRDGVIGLYKIFLNALTPTKLRSGAPAPWSGQKRAPPIAAPGEATDGSGAALIESFDRNARGRPGIVIGVEK